MRATQERNEPEKDKFTNLGQKEGFLIKPKGETSFCGECQGKEGK